jgi:hypothetical protein
LLHLAPDNPDSSSSSFSPSSTNPSHKNQLRSQKFKMQFSIAALVSVLAAAEIASAWQSMSNSHRERKHPPTIT